MSSISSTSTLPSWDPMELFSLMNPDKLSITCVGYALSKRRRCHNGLAYDNIQAAKEVVRQLVRPGVEVDELKEMLFNLAEYTLCRGVNHQSQATEVSDRWCDLVRRERGEDEDWGSDTSDDDDGDDDDDGGSNTGSSSDEDGDDDDDNGTPPRTTNSVEDLRRRLDDLETLQREFDELLQTQRQSLRNRIPVLLITPQQPRSNLQHAKNDHLHNNIVRQRHEERETLHAAEQTEQEETYLTSELERASTREELRRGRAEQAQLDDTRCQSRLEDQAEACRLKRERQAKAQESQQSHIVSWESAWSRYEAAWNSINITYDPSNSRSDFDIRLSQIWPTKSGSFLSCCEEDVMAFFRYQPGNDSAPASRRMLRRQALRWHPDRAVRLFESVVDEVVRGEVLKTVTMISQVVIGIMGVAAR